MFAGLLLIVVVVLVAPLAAYLPTAAMAGVLFLVAWGLIDFHHIGQVARSSRGEALTLGVTFFSALFLNLEFAILAGVILSLLFYSLLFYLSRTSRPRVVSRVPDPAAPHRQFTTEPKLRECPQCKFVRVDGSLFFGAVAHVRDSFRLFEARNPGQKHLVVIAHAINFVDSSGTGLLADEARRRREVGGGLYLIRPKDTVREALARGGRLAEIGEENVFDGKAEAIAGVFRRLDPAVCRTCTARIFRECQSAPAPAPTPVAAAPRPPALPLPEGATA